MKNRKINWTATLIVGLALLAAPALAMENPAGHEMAPECKGHNKGGMIMLGEEVQNGVKAMFHLMPVDPKNMPAGNRITHHLMVMFKDAATGKAVTSGTVAVKVESPEGKEAAPVRLMGMQGHFGADLTLDKPGIWHFRIASKLADGKVRQFHSHYVVK